MMNPNWSLRNRINLPLALGRDVLLEVHAGRAVSRHRLVESYQRSY